MRRRCFSSPVLPQIWLFLLGPRPPNPPAPGPQGGAGGAVGAVAVGVVARASGRRGWSGAVAGGAATDGAGVAAGSATDGAASEGAGCCRLRGGMDGAAAKGANLQSELPDLLGCSAHGPHAVAPSSSADGDGAAQIEITPCMLVEEENEMIQDLLMLHASMAHPSLNEGALHNCFCRSMALRRYGPVTSR